MPSLLLMFWLALPAMLMLTLVKGWVDFHTPGMLKGRWDPLVDPLFGDLTELQPVYRMLHTAAFSAGHVAYPPLGAVLYALLYATRYPVGFYLATATAWLVPAVGGVRRELIAQGIDRVTATLFPLTAVVLSFPIVGLLQRANIELFLWVFAALGTWAFLRGREHWAAVLWGLAGAIKLYPVLLLVLLLPRRRWSAFAEGVATFVGTTTLALWWLGPTMAVAWRGSIENVFYYQGARVSQWTLHEIMPNHSMFGLVKVAGLTAGLPVGRLMLPYYACGAVVMGGAFFARLWKMPVANQLLAVTAFMVMFPPVSYYYTLVNLYAPLLVLLFLAIRAQRAGVRIPGLRRTVLLFVPLFAPFTLLTFPRLFLYGGLVQAALLVALFGCALCFPFAADGVNRIDV